MADPTGFEDLVQGAPAVNSKPAPTGFEDLVQKPVEQKTEESPSFWDQLGRGYGIAQRELVEGLLSAPNMALGMAQTLAALPEHPEAFTHPFKPITGETPAQKTSQFLTEMGLPKPETTGEKVGGFLTSMIGGSALPIPVPASQVPANFVRGSSMKAQRLAAVLQRSQNSGLVVPPSTTNPTFVNRTLETIAGKDASQMGARVINQNARTAMAARDLHLDPDLMTPEAVAAVREEAGGAFDAARTIPRVTVDGQYINDLANVLHESHGANASFPGASNPDVENIVNTYLQPNFTGDSAVSALKLLRSNASDAFRQGRSELGRAYRGVASAIEAQLERGAQAAGQQYAPLVEALRNARRTYAQASTIEEAMDPLGNVSGPKLAAMWRRGEPLSGETLIAAEHAASFPKANLPANSSNISHLNMYGSIGLGSVGEHFGGHTGMAIGAALPFARGAARRYLLGPGQRSALPTSIGASDRAAELARALLRRPGTITAAENQD